MEYRDYFGDEIPGVINKYLQAFADLVIKGERYYRREESFDPSEHFCTALEYFRDENFSILSVIATKLIPKNITKKDIANLEKASLDKKIELYKMYSEEEDIMRNVKDFMRTPFFQKEYIGLVRKAGDIIEYFSPTNLDFFGAVLDLSSYYNALNALKEELPFLKNYDFEKVINWDKED